MPQSEDPLRLVPWTRIEELLEKLRSDIPHSLAIYGMVQVALRWKETDASQKIGLYTTNDRFEDGSIVGIYKVTANDFRITFHCFRDDASTLKNAFLTTSRLNWDSSKSTVNFLAFHESHLPLVRECLSQNKFQFKVEEYYYEWKTPDRLNSDVCNFTCPPEVRLAPVGLDSLDLVTSHWLSDVPGAADRIADLIRHNPSLGVYSRATGELCAWVLFSEQATLSILHTMEAHRRKGYAQLLCNALCQQLLSQGFVVGASALEDNAASLKIFNSLRFEHSRNFYMFVLGKASKGTG